MNTLHTLLLESDEYQQAVSFLAQGELVVVPTETVYGIAGDALSDEVCMQIYRVKNRPADNPFIVHCASIEMAEQCVNSHSPHALQALKILQEFSPGPITVIAPKSSWISGVACAGGDTVALRIPKHVVCRKIIEELGCPLAAPSANKSGMPSTTNGLAAWEAMQGLVAAVVNGGQCVYGVESTIVDCCRDVPTVVRLGAISTQSIAEKLHSEIKGFSVNTDKTSIPTVPGSKYKHYAPRCMVVPVYEEKMNALLSPASAQRTSKYTGDDYTQDIEKIIAPLAEWGYNRVPNHVSTHSVVSIGLCVLDSMDLDVDFFLHTCNARVHACNMPQKIALDYIRRCKDWQELTHILYELFIDLDRRHIDILYVVCPQYAQYSALHDRLMRASER